MTARTVKAAAWSVGEWSDLLARYALSTASQSATPETMRADLAKVHSIWRKLCRLMVELEELTPNATQAGADEDAFIRDWIEERAASRSANLYPTASISETA